MALDELPVEVLDRTCSFLSPNEVADWHLVNRAFAATGVEYLLPEITLFCVRERSKGAHKLTNYTAVARGVRSLCFQADRLQKKETFRDWDFEQEETICRGHGMNPQERRRCLQRHGALAFIQPSEIKGLVKPDSKDEWDDAYEAYGETLSGAATTLHNA